MHSSPTILVASMLALALPSSAQLDPDTVPHSIGILGGSATSVVVDPDDPDVILVIKYLNGIHRSQDGGLTFAPFGPLVSPDLRELIVDPTDSDTLYVLDGPQVLRSLDFGETWNPLSLFALDTLRGISIAPSGGGILVHSFGEVYHSADDGANWSIAATETVIDSIQYAPSDANVAYFGSINGVWRSANGGVSFTDPGPYDEWTQALTVDPTDPNTVYTGTPFDGVFRSLDGGATFTSIGFVGFEFNAEFFRYEPDGSRLWFATLSALFFSTDGGDNWSPASSGFPVQPPIPLDLTFDSDGNRLLGTESGSLGTSAGGGLYRMASGGTDWEHVAFDDVGVLDVAIAGPGGSTVVGLGNGVWQAAPGGTIQPTSWQADIGATTNVIAVDPSDSDRWLAGGVGAFFDNAQVLVMTNGGASFVKTYEVFGAGQVTEIEYDPFNPSNVLMGMTGLFGNAAITRSTDGGDTWTDANTSAGFVTRGIAFDPFVPDRVLQVSDNNQWSGSPDGGVTWFPPQPAWPASGPAVLLEADPFVQDMIYRGDAGDGLWRTIDGANSWVNLGVSLNLGSDLEVHPDVPGMFWVSNDEGQVLVTTDHGDTFDVAWELSPGALATALSFDPSNGKLVVGTANNSAWELPLASPFVSVGPGTEGTGGFEPRHFPEGGLPQLGNFGFALAGDRILGGAGCVVAVGLQQAALPLLGGTVYVDGLLFLLSVGADGTAGVGGDGSFSLPLPIPPTASLAGISVLTQFAALDSGVAHPDGFALSNGLRTKLLP